MIKSGICSECNLPENGPREDIGVQMVAICREVNKATGETAVYQLNAEVTSDLMFRLGIRARVNPELRYFVTLKSAWESAGGRQALIKSLKRRTLNNSHLDAIGGIEEL